MTIKKKKVPETDKVHRAKYANFCDEDLFKLLASVGVIVVPGADFRVERTDIDPLETGDEALSDTEETGDDLILRLTFAAASAKHIDEGIKRLSEGLKKYYSSF